MADLERSVKRLRIALIVTAVVALGAIAGLYLHLTGVTDELHHDMQVSQNLSVDERQHIRESVDARLYALEQHVAVLTQNISQIDLSQAELQTRADQLQRSGDISPVVEEVIPAVVSVHTEAGQGSGFFVRSDGLVVTNRHVVQGARVIRVLRSDGSVHDAEVLAVGRTVDLAVLQADTDGPVPTLAMTQEVRLGEQVFAVGAPLGLSFSVTQGVVSSPSRVIDASGVPYVQTDVPINRGNSGGPLINLDGDVVGVNTLRISGTDGLGFAIHADIVQQVVERATENI